MAETAFNVGDTVYLIASASQRGFIERYRISSIETEGLNFVYVIDINPVPQYSTVHGNWASGLPNKTQRFYEDQLSSDFSYVVGLAIAYHQNQIAYLQSLIGSTSDG